MDKKIHLHRNWSFKVTFGGESAETVADETGKWKLSLPKMNMSREGQIMTVRSSSGDALTYENVLVGEVWICSGQSNMEWSVSASKNPLEEAAAWAKPELDDSDWGRMHVPQNWEKAGYAGLDGIVWLRKTIEVPASWAGRDLALRPGPIDEVDVTWFNGEKVGETGNLEKDIVEFWNQPRDYRVPGELVKAGKNVIAIRVMDAQGQGGLWGGKPKTMLITPVDGDASESIALAGEWKIKAQYALPKKPRNPVSPNKPTVLYNQMIAPLIPYGIRGAIWYQGESNASRPEQYRTLLPTMIADWRQRWDRGDFPFLMVQLANFRAREDQPRSDNRARARAHQLPRTRRSAR